MAKSVERSLERAIERAQRLLDRCHYPEALTAFQAALIADPADPVAHVGIAECTIAMGRYELGIERLVNSAHRLAEAGNRHAHTLMKRAMILSPNQLELHVDAAQVELTLGEHTGAIKRLWRLALAYRGKGLKDEAREIEQLVESLQQPPEPGVVQPAQTGFTEPMRVTPGVPIAVQGAKTELVRMPILLFPDGTPMPTKPLPVTKKQWGKAPRRRPPAGSVRFRMQPPPKLKRPLPRA